MKILAILQARASSSRLPAKVLMPMAGAPMLARQIERVKRARTPDVLVLATSERADDDEVAKIADNAGIPCHRGSLDNVLDRFYTAAKKYEPDWIVRLTGDCPLADWEVIDRCVRFAIEGRFDYASNTLVPTWPDGLDVEVCTFNALAESWREAQVGIETEHVMPFMTTRPERFRLGSLESDTDNSSLRWTVDELPDYLFVREVYERLYPRNPAFTTSDVLDLIDRHRELVKMNAGIMRNAGLFESP